MSMKEHYVFKIHYTQRQAIGDWQDHETFNRTGWSEPKENSQLYVASKEVIARAHFEYWSPYCGSKDNPREIVRIENLGRAHMIVEL